jgi:hypothetical protein
MVEDNLAANSCPILYRIMKQAINTVPVPYMTDVYTFPKPAK